MPLMLWVTLSMFSCQTQAQSWLLARSGKFAFHKMLSNSYQECGVLESVKSASDMFSPVAGKVTEKNEEVENGPALINQSPLTDGWLFK